jgi:hypothetical protein
MVCMSFLLFDHTRFSLESHFFATSSQCQRGILAGVTMYGQLQQRLATENIAFHCQYATLIISQQQTCPPERLQ